MQSPAPDTAQRIVVTDDWTRNWQAKIAIKITAMFMWVIIFSAFLGVVYLTQGLVENYRETVADELDSLSYKLSATLLEQSADTPKQRAAAARALLEAERSHMRFDHLAIDLGSEHVEIGTPNDALQTDTRTIAILDPTADGGPQALILTASYLKPDTYAKQMRERYIVFVVLSVLALALLLRWTIHNVLAKPFQILVDATQSISQGDLDLRLDVSRQDEFGHLSRFFNQMLDRIQAQQDALTQKNKELKKEVAVRREAEERLLENRNELERTVIERTQDLALARDQALRASQTKSAFIANISHEIRTPLTPIIGFAEAMMNGTQTERECKRSLESIIRNGKHLLNIINDILDLSKIEADKLDVEHIPVNLFQLLGDVESVAGMLAREKGLGFSINYKFPLPSVIHSDPTRLKQVLMNLAMNAIKFTGQGSVIIETAFDQAGNKLLLDVVDTGVGISQENIDRLFRAFSQADSSTTRQYGGTGLGLYISRRLARLMGGDIQLTSAVGVGSRFTVSVDAGDLSGSDILSEMPDQIGSEELSPTLDAKVRGRVLLAEDSADNQQLITYYLTKMGAEVTLAENGAIAVEHAMANDFDLVLMDMQMPVMGGLEAVELLRAAGYGGVIVALTANAMKEDRERYERAGCDGFLSKPIELDRFNAMVRTHLAPADTAAQPDALDGDPEFERIANRFRENLPDYRVQLAEAHRTQDVECLARLVHQLKGMGTSFGFPAITEAATVADRLLKAQERSAGLEAVVRLIGIVDESSEQPPQVGFCAMR